MSSFHHGFTKPIRRFFVETFRAHTGKEYREIITRGMHADKSGENGQYPWLYIRIAALFFVVLAVNALILRITHNSMYVPSIIFLGGSAVNFVFMLFLYELYPGNDFSILSVVLIIILGGALAGLICQIVYYFWIVDNDWLCSLQTGVVEELAKGIVALVIIGILKCKKPFVGFLIGAAVGTGFSIIEDMGYLYSYSKSFLSATGIDLIEIISMFFSRAASAFCTHILWTAMIGWVTLTIQKPIKSFRFFLVLFSSIAIHTIWDFPIEGIWVTVVCILCGLTSGIFAIVVVARMRSHMRKENGVQISFFDKVPFQKTPHVKKAEKKLYFRHAANLSLTISCVLLSLLSFAYCMLPIITENREKMFTETDEFISYIQCGITIEPNWERAYVVGQANEEEYLRGGELAIVVQAEQQNDLTFYYTYNVVEKTYYLRDVEVFVVLKGVGMRYSYSTIDVGGKTIKFYELNSDVVRYSSAAGRIFVETKLPSEQQELITKETAFLLEIAAGIIGIEAVLFISFKWKERSIKHDDELQD
jgi:RsiW-degrading membrane proteinase PrsW (M82 family)